MRVIIFISPPPKLKMCNLLRGFNKGIKRHPYGAGTIGTISDHSHCVTVAYVIELTSGEG